MSLAEIIHAPVISISSALFCRVANFKECRWDEDDLQRDFCSVCSWQRRLFGKAVFSEYFDYAGCTFNKTGISALSKKYVICRSGLTF